MTTPPDDPRADEGLVEAMAMAMVEISGWRWDAMDDPQDVDWFDQDERGWWRDAARAALTAARSHGGI